MTTNEIKKPPKWFWIVSIVALLWNLMGVFNYLNSAFNKEGMLEAMTQEQRATFESIPAWATGAVAVAVFTGVFASIALLIRKKWAYPLFIVSLIAAVAQFVNWLFISGALETYGPTAYIMPILVVSFGIYLIFFSKKGILQNWLN